jgi:hypothetical protein
MTANDISVRQNQPEMIRYLAAQRQLYSEEKRWMMIWYALVTAIALAATGFLPATDKFLHPVTVLVVILAGLEFVVLPFIGHKQVVAAGIQELFDCEVLQLEWNEVLVDKPDPYQIDGAVDRFNRRPKCEEAYGKLSDWYLGFTPDTPLMQARLICQKMNLVWDQDVRREWKMWLYVGLGAVVILSVLLGAFFQWTVTTYATGPFLLLIPLALSALKAALKQNSVHIRLDQLNRQCEYLLRDATHIDADETAIHQQSRQLQDEIYRHRITDTTVPDFIYEQVRKRRELHLAERATEK